MRFDMLPIQLPIVPVNLFVSSPLQNIPPSANATRSGAGPAQNGRIHRVREKGTYKSTRSISRPSSGGSVPPRSFEEAVLRQPTRVASTAPAPPAAQDPPRAIAERNPRPRTIGRRCDGLRRVIGRLGARRAVRMGRADRVCPRVILRGRPSTHTTTECPSARAPHGGAPRSAHSTHHASRRAARFPPVLPRIG